MADPNASRSLNYLPPAGEINTLLTERPEFLRQILLEQLYASARGIAQAISDEAYYVKRGTCRKSAEKAVHKRMMELQECMMLLAQIGWR
jgi:hypothetical protein